MKHSEAIDALAEALAKAQGAMEGASKRSLNPFFKSRYADLKAVWEACRTPLSENKLSVVQAIRCEHPTKEVNELAKMANDQGLPPAVIVTTILMHSSGQWISEELTMWPRENTPQAIGTCGSYARRYGLAGMIGVYQEDDDGNKASGHGVDESAEAAQVLEGYFNDLVNAIKTNDVATARQRWNELNTLGSASDVWRLLNTQQKGAVRQLLQQTAPPSVQHVVLKEDTHEGSSEQGPTDRETGGEPGTAS